MFLNASPGAIGKLRSFLECITCKLSAGDAKLMRACGKTRTQINWLVAQCVTTYRYSAHASKPVVLTCQFVKTLLRICIQFKGSWGPSGGHGGPISRLARLCLGSALRLVSPLSWGLSFPLSTYTQHIQCDTSKCGLHHQRAARVPLLRVSV